MTMKVYKPRHSKEYEADTLYWNKINRINEMVDLYKYGFSTYDIGILYNITRERARQILKSVISLRPRGGPNFKGKIRR